MITEELLDRLVVATREAKDAVRECHEARRDLRITIKEADDRLGKVRAEVVLAVDELATEKTKELFDQTDYAKIGDGLRKTLDQWLDLLADATQVLDDLATRRDQLKAGAR